MQRALTRSGYNVCELVSAGEDAVERVNQKKLDLIIMDVILNGSVNGVEAAMEIRTRSDIPIVFITGYDEEKLIERIKSVKSSTYLIKPFTLKALESAIAHALLLPQSGRPQETPWKGTMTNNSTV